MYLRCDHLAERYQRQPVRACGAFASPPAGAIRALTPATPEVIPIRWLSHTHPSAPPTSPTSSHPALYTLNEPLSDEALRALTGDERPRPTQHPGDALIITHRAPNQWSLGWQTAPARDITLAIALRPLTHTERGALEAHSARVALMLGHQP